MKIFIEQRKKAMEAIQSSKDILVNATELFEDYVEEEVYVLQDIEFRLFVLYKRIQLSIKQSIARDWDEEGL